MIHFPTLRTSALALAALVVFQQASLAQATLEWTAFHGVSFPTEFYDAQYAAVDAVGNVHVAVSRYNSAGSVDFEVAKFSATGALIWSRYINPVVQEWPSGIQVASNGDVCVAGSRLPGGQFDGFVLRYDAAGNLIANTNFAGAPGNGDDGFQALAIDAQDNLVVAGHATDALGHVDMVVQAYSPLGNLLWDTRIDGAAGGSDYAMALVIDASGAIFVAGSVDVPTHWDSAIAKLTANGALQWLRISPSSVPSDDGFSTLTSDRQGGVVAGGYTRLPGGPPGLNTTGLVARCDGAGNFSWGDLYPNGPMQSWTQFVVVDDGGVSWALHFYDWLGTPRALLTRHSAAGVRLSAEWIPFADYPAGLAAGNAGQMFLCAGGGGLVLGPNQYSILAQFDSAGTLNWQRNFAPSLAGAYPSGLQLAPNSRAVIHGRAPTGPNGYAALVMQIDLSESPHGFCAGKPNSLGCAPRTVFTGMSSASMSSGFAIQVERVRNQKPGLFVYSVSGQAATPFAGGLLCVSAPVRRTMSVHSGGGPAVTQDCSGVYSIDMNAFASGALGGSPAPALTTPGTHVWLQAMGRDSGFPAPNNLSLSSGLTYAVLP